LTFIHGNICVNEFICPIQLHNTAIFDAALSDYVTIDKFYILRMILSFVLISERKSFSVVLSDKYWDWYITIKHVSEIVVLVSQLAISTAIKTVDVIEPSLSALRTARGFRR
jgi:hypothetical protein